MANSRPMYREDVHDGPPPWEIEAGKRAEETRNGRISTLINQAIKLTHVIDDQIGGLSERLQPITRPMMTEPSEGMILGDRSGEVEHRESPIAEQIDLVIRRLQQISSRLGDIPERLDV